MNKKYYQIIVFLMTVIFSVMVRAEESVYIITEKNKEFSPKELVIPADKKVKLLIKNLDSKVIEFESTDFNREKIIPANGEAVIYVGPLKSGTYHYFDDFNRDNKAAIIVK